MNFRVFNYESKLGHYILKDDLGRFWRYKQDPEAENDNSRGFQAWPREYGNIMTGWTNEECDKREQLEATAENAIKTWKFKKELNPETAKTFEELIDEL